MDTIPSKSTYTETLNIENFLSIQKFHWNIKQFNIITGDMGAGKSLCIKLLIFFEEIIASSILLAPGFSKKLFENGNFFDRLSEKFWKLFCLDGHNCQDLNIAYSCKVNGSNFAITVKWNDEQKKLVWECDYFTNNLSKWSSYFSSPETPDMAQALRVRIHEEITHDFMDKLPIMGIFVPASRAALAVVGSNTVFKDYFLNRFAEDKDFLLSHPDISLNNELADILKVKNIAKNTKDEGDVVLIHNDGRTVPSLFSSSGQQELVYLLLLMQKLPDMHFLYGRMLSVFVEEPSAHLFPKEQKELMEGIITLFREKNELNTRYFITTHSPYVLNVINNMLRKGSILNRNPEKAEEINNKIPFPGLFTEEISASFINGGGTVTDMLDPNEEILFADKIADISYLINEDTIKLDNLSNELLRVKAT
jgi:ABC-type ATPase involved in cell division